MFDRILLALAGPDVSPALVALVARLAAGFGARVTVLHVLETPLTAAALGEQTARRAGIETDSAAARLLAEAVAQLQSTGVPATGRLGRRPASVARQVVEHALDDRIDLVVVGTHVPNDLDSPLLGSTTHEIIRLAHCPVLVVPPAPPKTLAAPSRVLLATDDSPSARKALPVAAELVNRLGGSLVALTVQPGSHGSPPDPETVAELAADAARGLGVAEARPEARVGLPDGVATAVLEAVASLHADLVVMGARGLSPLRAALVGSVTRGVIRGSPCPVLVVR